MWILLCSFYGDRLKLPQNRKLDQDQNSQSTDASEYTSVLLFAGISSAGFSFPKIVFLNVPQGVGVSKK